LAKILKKVGKNIFRMADPMKFLTIFLKIEFALYDTFELKVCDDVISAPFWPPKIVLPSKGCEGVNNIFRTQTHPQIYVLIVPDFINLFKNRTLDGQICDDFFLNSAE
jgi:hypothetical protein